MVELLAPVGKLENAYAAIENGANALFVGGKCFNARKYADNFTDEELETIVRYAKLRDVAVHVTVNIVIKEQEMEELIGYLTYLNELGVDALIVQDLGVARLVKTHFPQMVLHASTQMSAHSIEDVLFLKEAGFSRVVLARELQLDEIKDICEKCDVEIETFIHGAMCYSYSGQCLMSSLIGGRSGNRGRCAQPCRMRYTLQEGNRSLTEDTFMLSLKDMCTLEDLPTLIAAGITSFKIEGRMKSPEYVASVVSTYRKYIDLAEKQLTYQVAREDWGRVEGIFNRGGFSKGYYFQKSGVNMITEESPKHLGVRIGTVIAFSPKTSTATIRLEGNLNAGDGIEILRTGKESVGAGISRAYKKGDTLIQKLEGYVAPSSPVYLTKNHQLIKSLKASYQKPLRKIPVELLVVGKIGKPLYLQLKYKDLTVTYQGEIVQQALEAPLTEEKVMKQLTKFGNTSFVVATSSAQWTEGAYLAISQLNEARRQVIALLEAALLKKENMQQKPIIRETPKTLENSNWHVGVRTLQQLKICLDYTEITRIYWEWQYNNEDTQIALEQTKKAGKEFYIAFPSIIKTAHYTRYKKDFFIWEKSICDGYLVRTYGLCYLFSGTTKKIQLDYNFNLLNNEAVLFWQDKGIDGMTLSPELTRKESEALRGPLERLVYGYLPVMTTSQCLLGNYKQCQKGKDTKRSLYLKDRKDSKWPIVTDCEGCVMQLLTPKPLVVKQVESFNRQRTTHLRLQFTFEKDYEIKQICEAYLYKDEKSITTLDGVAFKTVE
ncbi:hypothetical protein CS063_06885 [Sporanaerobium hydrogeniformans]|uniref:Uncharacterized protein n=1 Tax=Sporanaerobium hydrogeniformans TaxID=3072179 RepID=A0AC61DCK0_9FIRM|nr:U32 family peptidase [Sporanaerobium hydrogeniformans]PHV71054.1 hypothetical protein CS063_06885 [Sporanaerobium hydrogeniformans]